jgi:photosystem II stability/assembly factor-like uncharacterized protein
MKKERIMRRVLLISGICFFLQFQTTWAQWIIEKSPSVNTLNSVWLTDSKSGWIVGDKGTILERSGSKWMVYQSPTKEDLYSVFMTDRMDGWAVGAHGTILHFDGRKWESFISPSRNDLFSVYFTNRNLGIAVGENGTLLEFENNEWSSVDTKMHSDFLTAYSTGENVIIGGGVEYLNVPIFKFENTGDKSFRGVYDPGIVITCITFSGPDEGWAVGSPSTILHFNGREWENDTPGFKFPTLKSITVKDKAGFGVGYCGTILELSQDGWKKVASPTAEHLNGSAITGNMFTAVGEKGTIISKELPSGLNPSENIEAGQMNLELYPNPCDKTLNLTINNPDSGFTEGIITISDVFGQVFQRKKINLSSGYNLFPLATSNLKSGAYMLNFYAGSGVSSAKFIVR